MKKRLFKKAAALALSVLLVSGGTPMLPADGLLGSLAITASATTTSTVTVDGSEATLYTGFTATAGNGKWYDKFVDGDSSSYWQAQKNREERDPLTGETIINGDFGGGTEDPAFVEFYADQAFVPSGYFLTCADNDAGFWKPVEWALKAKLNESDDWTVIQSATETLGEGTRFQIPCSNYDSNSYKYFRFEIYEVGSTLQARLNELEFYSYELSMVDLAQTGSYTAQDGDVLTGSTSGTVTIEDGAGVTLYNANVGGGIVCAGTATITLEGTNSATGPSVYKAGVRVGGAGTTLTIRGSGSLTANGSQSAPGIGVDGAWRVDSEGGDIVIEGGTITANGNEQWGAGIGTGVVYGGDTSRTARLGNITIKGGTVTATGGSEANGIGTGYCYSGCTNQIGTVTVYDSIEKVEASSIKNSDDIVYKHGETVVNADRNDYFTVGSVVDRMVIVPKDNTSYTVTAANNAHGTVTCAGTAIYGQTVILTAAPASGYKLESITVTDATGGNVPVSDMCFIMPKSNVTVTASFVEASVLFDAQTGVLTLRGNVDPDALDPYKGDGVVTHSPVTSVVCAQGTVLPEDCLELFVWFDNAVTIDLSNADTSHVRYTDRMFSGCRTLTTIYVSSSWSMENVLESDSMFLSCDRLVGGSGTTYEATLAECVANGDYYSAYSGTYAVIDDPANGHPGYLTKGVGDPAGEQLAGYTLSLDGDIGINFYMALSDSIKYSPTAKMVFTIPNTGNTTTKEVFVSDVVTDPDLCEQIYDKTYYIFPCRVAAKEMTSEIKAQIIDSENGVTGNVYTYSVKQYADYIIDHPSLYADEAVDLAKAMLYYGGTAQTLFDFNTDNMANADLGAYTPLMPPAPFDECDLSAVNAAANESGLRLTNVSLILESETTLRLYFRRNVSGTDPLPTLTDGENTYTAAQKRGQKVSGEYYYNITGFAAGKVFETRTLHFEGSYTEFDVCIGNYANWALDSSNNTELANTIIALYNYNECAKVYEAMDTPDPDETPTMPFG